MSCCQRVSIRRAGDVLLFFDLLHLVHCMLQLTDTAVVILEDIAVRSKEKCTTTYACALHLEAKIYRVKPIPTTSHLLSQQHELDQRSFWETVLLLGTDSRMVCTPWAVILTRYKLRLTSCVLSKFSCWEHHNTFTDTHDVRDGKDTGRSTGHKIYG